MQLDPESTRSEDEDDNGDVITYLDVAFWMSCELNVT